MNVVQGSPFKRIDEKTHLGMPSAGANGAAAGNEGDAVAGEGEREIERGRIYFLYRPKVRMCW